RAGALQTKITPTIPNHSTTDIHTETPQGVSHIPLCRAKVDGSPRCPRVFLPPVAQPVRSPPRFAPVPVRRVQPTGQELSPKSLVMLVGCFRPRVPKATAFALADGRVLACGAPPRPGAADGSELAAACREPRPLAEKRLVRFVLKYRMPRH
ncbi:hypothetical protein, partial [Alkalilacustris brevis]|uniref:hypothetical protein n=1 Tax=Alkalilacustris brevis TaxID=2026338 RepID=UPI001EE42B98